MQPFQPPLSLAATIQDVKVSMSCYVARDWAKMKFVFRGVSENLAGTVSQHGMPDCAGGSRIMNLISFCRSLQTYKTTDLLKFENSSPGR